MGLENHVSVSTLLREPGNPDANKKRKLTWEGGNPWCVLEGHTPILVDSGDEERGRGGERRVFREGQRSAAADFLSFTLTREDLPANLQLGVQGPHTLLRCSEIKIQLS